MWLMPRWRASLRLLQWVEPSAAGLRVHSRILASSAGVRFLYRSSGVVGVQACQPLSFETPLPATDIVGVASKNLANRQVGLSLRQQQDQPRPAHILGRQRARAQPFLQFRTLTRAQAKLSCKHAS